MKNMFQSSFRALSALTVCLLLGTLTTTNRFFDLSANPMALTVNVTNGYLSGWFKVPGLGKTNQFKGVLLQEQNRGDGYFLGTNQSGRVLLGPAP